MHLVRSLLLFLVVFLMASSGPAWGQPFEVLYSESISRHPEGHLVQDSNGDLYGTTYSGGPTNNGTVFKVTPAGERTTIYTFNAVDGRNPTGGLLLAADGNLYGTTQYGGTANSGSAFKLTRAGELTTIYSFSGLNSSPSGFVQGSDGNFYGTITSGGANGRGRLYKLTPAGELTLLYSFGSGDGGSRPNPGLVEGSAGTFYGTTFSGGASGVGTVFKITADRVLTTLHSFSFSGRDPETGLVKASDGNFYGTTSRGGVYNNGTVFRMTPGGVVTNIYSFFLVTSGSNPRNALLQGSDGHLYGSTFFGGPKNEGTVFKLTLDGTFTVVHSFGRVPNGEKYEVSARLLQGSDGNLYGVTRYGGDSNFGTIFKIPPAGALTTIHSFTDIRGRGPAGVVRGSDGDFYGTTAFGGAALSGTAFKITPDGVLTSLFSFNNDSGTNPRSGLIQGNDGNFYGTASAGGANGAGTVFKMTDQGQVTTLVALSTATGTKPQARLLMGLDGNFYGTAREGGASGGGTVFRVTHAGELSALHSFDGTNGSYPQAGLVLDGSGNFYGTTREGGANNFGTVFRMTSAGVLTTLHSFNRTNGSYPEVELVRGDDGNFYGTTREGGANSYGTVFRITPAGVLTTLHSFNRTNGSVPEAGLIKGPDGNFYGTTREGGAVNYGTVFRITPGGVFTLLHSFDGSAAAYPSDGLVFGSDDSLYGTAQELSVWRLELPSSPTVVTGAASGITVRGAVLQGSVNANDAVTAVSFEYGLTTAYGSTITALQSSVSGSTETNVFVDVMSLQPHTLYHFRVKATSIGGTTVGTDATFTTGNTSPVGGSTTGSLTTGDTVMLTLPFASTDADGDTVTVQSISKSAGAPFVLGAVDGNKVTLTGAPDAIGSGTITYTVTDGFGGIASGSVNVTVTDNDKPVFTGVPVDLTLEATSTAGAVGTYASASATDNIGLTGLTYSHASGSEFPLGATQVTVTALDAAGNVGTQSFTVTVRDTTAPAFVTVPPSMTVEATSAAGAVATYAAASATDALGVTGLAYSHATGFVFPLGATLVTATARDAAGNQATANFTITVQDTAAPTITGVFSPLRARAGTPLVDYRSQVLTSDTVGVSEVTQTPAPGSPLAEGLQQVTLTVRDAAGNEAGTNFTVKGTPLTPEGESVLATGDAVPGAGTVQGIPAGAVWESFGVPCVTGQGDMAFTAVLLADKVKHASVILQRSSGAPLQVLASVGDAVPEILGATFRKFKDPIAVTTAEGQTVVVFQATISGSDVKGSDKNVLCRFSELRGLELLGRTGVAGTTVGTDGVQVASFTSLGLAPDGALWSTATLKPGAGGVTKASSQALMVWDRSSTEARIVLRKGDLLETSAGEKSVSTIGTLVAAGGSPGHGRWMAAQGLVMRLSFTDRTSGIYTVGSDSEEFAEVAREGAGVLVDQNITQVEWASFGLPAIDGAGGVTFLGQLRPGVGGVTGTDSTGIFRRDQDQWESVVRIGVQTSVVPAPTFTAFKDPVSNAQGMISFITKEKSTVSGKKALAAVWTSVLNDEAEENSLKSRTLKRVARVAEPAIGANGAVFASFVSLALPDGEDAGPLFVAKLADKGGTISGSLWTVDQLGVLHLVLRNGFSVPGLETRGAVKNFTVLSAVAGSSGQPRAYDSQAEALCRVVFRDRSQALVKIALP